MLINRTRELASLTDCMERVHHRGSAMLIRGEPGIGKSALLDEVGSTARARGFHVLAIKAVQFEAHLPYAGLHLLLLPLFGEMERLPPAHRAALKAAFGLSDRAAPDPFMIALATLNLLCDCASPAPLVILVDDAHWIDPATADVLAFVARRVDSDPVLLLAALRDGHDSVLMESGCPMLTLDGLSDPEASALLSLHAPGLPPAMHERVLRDSAGNPLALIELPIALRTRRGASTALAPSWVPVTERLEKAFVSRLAHLPPAARTLLFVASADEGATLAEVLDAASALEGCPVAIRDAVVADTSGLIHVQGGQIRFRHPLMRSAIYETMSLHERISVHNALAGVLGHQPDRRAWHRASAAIASDEEVAVELEHAAERAQRRGAGSLAIAALERAAELSDGPARRAERLIRVAELAYQLGQPATLMRVLRELRHSDAGTAGSARLAWLQHFFREDVVPATALVSPIVEAATRMRLDGHVDRALGALQMVSMRLWWAGSDGESRAHAVAATEQLPVPRDDPSYIATLALAAPVERGAFVVDQLSRFHAHTGADGEARYLLGLAGTGVGAFVHAKRHLDAAAVALRAEARLGLLAQSLVAQAWTDVLVGTWSSAVIAAAETTRLAREHGQPLRVVVAQLAEATVLAYRGERGGAEQLAAECEQVLLAAGASSMFAMVHFARGAAALAEGRHPEAWQHLRRPFDPADAAYHPHMRGWMLVDLVDAALHAGRLDEARAVVRALEAEAEISHSPLLRAALAFSRPRVADEASTGAEFMASLKAPPGDWPFINARLHLAFGAWLRRGRQVAESRAPLRFARDTFSALGAAPWTERAVRELRAAGEASRGRRPDAVAQLSAQELQIAQMAADGLSNKEIGRLLFLSHRTVSSHLYRAFPKLGITTRAQLRKALRQPELP